MKNLIKLFILFLLPISVLAQEKPIKATSTIKSVTVFLTGAQIQREGSASIPSGVSEIVFSDLSDNINQQSIQVKGVGDFTILSVNKQANFLNEQSKSEEIRNLQARIKKQDEILLQLNDETEILKTEEEILRKNQTTATDANGIDVAKLKILLDFQRSKLIQIKNDLKLVESKREEETKKSNDLKNQLGQLVGKSVKNTSDIVVKVNAKSALKASFSITYLVNNASWYPTYDIRAKDVNEPIQLVYKANVSQRSGEDWSKVNIALSSGNPTEDNNVPALNPYFLGYNLFDLVGNLMQITRVSGTVSDANDRKPLPGVSVKIKGTSIATITDVNGNYQIAVPQDSKTIVYSFIGFEAQERIANTSNLNVFLQVDQTSLNEVAVVGYGTNNIKGRLAGVSSGTPGGSVNVMIRGSNSFASKPIEVVAKQEQTSLLFNIKETYSVPSDGKLTTVEIGNYDIPAEFIYTAIPKLSKNVSLTAKIKDFNELNLLSGEANIFFDGTFLGSSLLNIQQAKDTLDISLGSDKNVIITREKQKDFKEKQFLGSSERVSRDFLITVKNRKAKAIDLIINDQLPVSNNENITVEKVDISNAEFNEKDGKLTWKLKMQPNEEKKLNLKYQVKYPKNAAPNLE